MKSLKNIGAVVAGFLTVVILSVLTDFILESLGIFPPIGKGIFITWMLLLAFAYRSIFTILSGHVTAKLSSDRPTRNVVILGIVGTIAGTFGMIVGWNMSQHWYPIALATTAFPLCWLGGKLKIKYLQTK